MKLSPDIQDKIKKFRKNKRAFYSLLILTGLFLCTLPAEFIFNDKPLVMTINGKIFFPVFKQYTYKDLGGEDNVPVLNYHSEMFTKFIEGEIPSINTEVLFPKEKRKFDPDNIVPQKGNSGSLIKYKKSKKPDVWILWTPIPYSYNTFYTSKILDRQRLADPFEHTNPEGKVIPGANEEKHYLGTDKFGNDVLARLVYGFRMSLVFGLSLAITSTLLGCIIGGIQGFFGGLIDLLGQRGMEIWGAIPRLLLLMILSDFLSRQGDFSELQHLLMLFMIMNLTSWMGMASHMRAQFLRARNLDYVKAAKALGVSNVRIMSRHIMPNSLVPIVTFMPFSISSGILALVSLDFLGFGLKYPAPSLGELLSQGQQYLSAWWIMIPTFLTLTILTILLTFIGDGVRNAFDPRYK